MACRASGKRVTDAAIIIFQPIDPYLSPTVLAATAKRLKGIASGWSAEEIQALTEPRLKVAEDLKQVEL